MMFGFCNRDLLFVAFLTISGILIFHNVQAEEDNSRGVKLQARQPREDNVDLVGKILDKDVVEHVQLDEPKILPLVGNFDSLRLVRVARKAKKAKKSKSGQNRRGKSKSNKRKSKSKSHRKNRKRGLDDPKPEEKTEEKTEEKGSGEEASGEKPAESSGDAPAEESSGSGEEAAAAESESSGDDSGSDVDSSDSSDSSGDESGDSMIEDTTALSIDAHYGEIHSGDYPSNDIAQPEANDGAASPEPSGADAGTGSSTTGGAGGGGDASAATTAAPAGGGGGGGAAPSDAAPAEGSGSNILRSSIYILWMQIVFIFGIYRKN